MAVLLYRPGNAIVSPCRGAAAGPAGSGWLKGALGVLVALSLTLIFTIGRVVYQRYLGAA